MERIDAVLFGFIGLRDMHVRLHVDSGIFQSKF